jgi:hypothetical protein
MFFKFFSTFFHWTNRHDKYNYKFLFSLLF